MGRQEVVRFQTTPESRTGDWQCAFREHVCYYWNMLSKSHRKSEHVGSFFAGLGPTNCLPRTACAIISTCIQNLAEKPNTSAAPPWWPLLAAFGRGGRFWPVLAAPEKITLALQLRNGRYRPLQPDIVQHVGSPIMGPGPRPGGRIRKCHIFAHFFSFCIHFVIKASQNLCFSPTYSATESYKM